MYAFVLKEKILGKMKRQLKGDISTKKMVERMVRVDHAGEYGAVRIYQGQLRVLGQKPISKTIAHMLEQENLHLRKFEREIVQRRVRPTALLPVWHVCGFVLGAGSAILGEKAAMACTVAVEEVIDKHYAEQINDLEGVDGERKLQKTFKSFREEELEHRDLGRDKGAEDVIGYPLFREVVKAGSRLAIWLSKRL